MYYDCGQEFRRSQQFALFSGISSAAEDGDFVVIFLIFASQKRLILVFYLIASTLMFKNYVEFVVAVAKEGGK